MAKTKHQVRVAAGKKAARTRRRRELNGTGFFSDLWSGVKSVGNFVKDNKLISTGLSMIPHPGAQRAGAIAGQFGLGRKRRIRRRAVLGALPVNRYYAPRRKTMVLPNMMGLSPAHALHL